MTDREKSTFLARKIWTCGANSDRRAAKTIVRASEHLRGRNTKVAKSGSIRDEHTLLKHKMLKQGIEEEVQIPWHFTNNTSKLDFHYTLARQYAPDYKHLSSCASTAASNFLFTTQSTASPQPAQFVNPGNERGYRRE